MDIEGKTTRKWQLSCCALFQLTAISDTSLEELEWQINKAKTESKQKWNPRNRDSGERGCFTIVSPGEDRLRTNLIRLNFSKVWEFPRRNGYPDGILEMWVKSW